jgi:hypothetical protein
MCVGNEKEQKSIGFWSTSHTTSLKIVHKAQIYYNHLKNTLKASIHVSIGVMECWSTGGKPITPIHHYPITPDQRRRTAAL